MDFQFAGGVWPVMLTPFTKDREIDFKTLKQLVEWYIERGSSGLFAVCQSSEMFYLSFEERAQNNTGNKKMCGGPYSCYYIRAYFLQHSGTNQRIE